MHSPLQATSAPPPNPTFPQALRFWLKLGCISFGGPAGQIALMHEELVVKRRWISDKRFVHALNYCMLLPGPEAQQLATYIGWLLHRTWGGVAAGVLFVLPSLLLLIALSWGYMVWGSTAWMASLLAGLKPAVLALVVVAAWRLGKRMLKTPFMVTLAVLALMAVGGLKLPFPAVVAAAALAGWAVARWQPTWLVQPSAGRGATTHANHAPAVIADATPTPDHAQHRSHRLIRTLILGLMLWILPIGALALLLGLAHSYTQMGWFFTKAALLTFGGAYAVLPYMVQGAVMQHGWLSTAQMMDGLALGESTPGPLIMIVAFVGFVGAYQSESLITQWPHIAPWLLGAVGAVVVTWFTFLPSFIFILAGGPLVESTHGHTAFTAPLAAVSSAVVGVIGHLALVFGAQLLWPQGWSGAGMGGIFTHFNGLGLALAVAAFIALLRGVNVLWVLLAAALAGLAWQMPWA